MTVTHLSVKLAAIMVPLSTAIPFLTANIQSSLLLHVQQRAIAKIHRTEQLVSPLVATTMAFRAVKRRITATQLSQLRVALIVIVPALPIQTPTKQPAVTFLASKHAHSVLRVTTPKPPKLPAHKAMAIARLNRTSQRVQILVAMSSAAILVRVHLSVKQPLSQPP